MKFLLFLCLLGPQVYAAPDTRLDPNVLEQNLEAFRSGDQYYMTSHVLLGSLEGVLGWKLMRYAQALGADAQRLKILESRIAADREELKTISFDVGQGESTVNDKRMDVLHRIETNEREMYGLQRNILARATRSGLRVLSVAGVAAIVVNVGAKAYIILALGKKASLFPVIEALRGQEGHVLSYISKMSEWSR